MKSAQLWFYIEILLQIIIQVLSLKNNGIHDEASRIAIVGAGIGGASTAFFLSELLNNDQVQHYIDIYEAHKVGGRLSEVEINGLKYDSGGCVIHSSNMYMEYFRKKLGYKKRRREPSEKFGIYDGKQFAFIVSDWSILNYINFIWRYGFSALNLQSYVDGILKTFQRLYDYQAGKKTFTDTEDLLKSLNVDFPHYLTVSLKDGLLKQGFSETFIDEVVKAGLMCNYGQGTNVHQFVGLVSIAGMDSSLWSVDGGQSQIAKGLIERSGARLILSRVDEIHLNEDSTFTLFMKNRSKSYDYVVIATPLTNDAPFPIIFKQFPEMVHIPGHYQRTVATILQGKLNHTYFNLDRKSIPSLIINVGNHFFNSVGKIFPVQFETNIESNVWKIFSPMPLTTEQMQDLFYEISEVQVIDWLAYPHYDTSKRKDVFSLHKNLFYLNGVEWVASAMEMSSISAKNIALLIANIVMPNRQFQKSNIPIHDKEEL